MDGAFRFLCHGGREAFSGDNGRWWCVVAMGLSMCAGDDSSVFLAWKANAPTQQTNSILGKCDCKIFSRPIYLMEYVSFFACTSPPQFRRRRRGESSK